VVGFLSICALAIYVFTTLFATLVGIFGFILSFILVSITAIVSPYRRRDMFEASPVSWRIAGVPVVSIVGVLSLAACIFMEWDYLNDPLSGLGTSGQGLVMLIVNIAIFISGLVIYFIARTLQNRRGVDVSAAFSEIPVD